MANSTLGKNQEWAQAADSAKDAATSVGEMAYHAASAVGGMASQAASDAGTKADDLAASAGIGIQGWGEKLSRNSPHEGMLGSASQAVAQTVKQGGEYLEGQKLSGMAGDVAHLVRRNPIPAICIAAGLGWFIGRILKK